jgi:integrase
MSIRKRIGKRGTRYQVRVGGTSIGTYRLRAAAEQAERDAIDVRERGCDVAAERANSKVTLAQLFEEHQTHLRKKGRELGTLAFYEEAWGHISPTHGDLPVRRFDLKEFDELIERAQEKGGLLPSKLHRLLRAMLFFACKRRYIERNVLSKQSGFDDAPSQPRSRARAVTPEEAARILDAARGHRLYEFWLLSVLCGTRGQELIPLTWSDVSLDADAPTLTISRAVARIPKSMRAPGSTERWYVKNPKSPDGRLRTRTVPLDEAAVDALRAVWARQMREKRKAGEGYQDQGLVFASPLGNMLSRVAISHAFTRLARRLSIDGVSLHSCRHAFATWAISQGADRHSVAQTGGWSRPSFMIDRYCNAVSGGAVRAASLVGAALADAQERLTREPNPGPPPRTARAPQRIDGWTENGQMLNLGEERKSRVRRKPA